MKNKPFELIPAIDILDGKCVRLTQGRYNLIEEFSTNPVEIAKKWLDLGARRLHIVDLDGAKEGYPVNQNIICKIVKNTKAKKAKIQVGGGIRTYKDIREYFENGADFIILGTKAFEDRTFLNKAVEMYQGKIIVGMDLKNRRIALSGWKKTKDIKLNNLSQYLRNIKQIIYTDISKDGTLAGPNIKSIKEIANHFKSKIIVSGGLSSIDDILRVLKLKEDCPNICGIILGKSLYKGTIDLRSALKAISSA